MSLVEPTRGATPGLSVLPLTIQALHAIMPNAPLQYLNPLSQAMSIYEINTPKRAAGFLSQLAVESQELRHTHELWTRRKDFQLPGVRRAKHTATSQKDYFEYWYGKRADLGNITAEDGYTYRGRGAIQITGRANYRAIGAGTGKPLETHPDSLAADPNTNMLASAYFFARLKLLNPVAESVDAAEPQSVAQVNTRLTLKVNGGRNGLAERLRYFKKGLEVLGA